MLYDRIKENISLKIDKEYACWMISNVEIVSFYLTWNFSKWRSSFGITQSVFVIFKYVLLHFVLKCRAFFFKQLAKSSLYYVNSKGKTSKEEVNGCDSQHLSLCIRIALSLALHVLDTRTMHGMLSYFKEVLKWDVGNNKLPFHHVSTIIPLCSKSWFGLVWLRRTRNASDKCRYA